MIGSLGRLYKPRKDIKCGLVLKNSAIWFSPVLLEIWICRLFFSDEAPNRRSNRGKPPEKRSEVDIHRWGGESSPQKRCSFEIPCWYLHSRRLTWNLRIHPRKRKIIFQTIIFRFYVNLRGCNMNFQSLILKGFNLLSTSGLTRSLPFMLLGKRKIDGWVDWFSMPGNTSSCEISMSCHWYAWIAS